jgi:hypothetical protein
LARFREVVKTIPGCDFGAWDSDSLT